MHATSADTVAAPRTNPIAVQHAPPAILDGFDFARGVAIVGIVMVHAVRGWFGWQGVNVFVVLGGFGLTWGMLPRSERPDWRAWYRRRMARILPSYWATVLGGFALVMLFRALAPGRAAPGDTSPFRQLALDVLLLRDLSYRTMFADPNASLWYVPFVASVYAVFPWLYERLRRARDDRAIAAFFAGACVVELAYRGVAMFLLDGKPVAFGHGFLGTFGAVPSELHRVPDAFSFQLWAPFGLAPSRLGEFALGMAAAALAARRGDAVTRWTTGLHGVAVGATLWLAGNALLYAGPIGWIAADLLVAAGLTMLVLALAHRLAHRRGRIWRFGTWLGVWSYYVFLVHVAVGYAASQIVLLVQPRSPLVLVALVPFVVVGIVLACRALRALDASSAGERLGRWLVPAPRA